MAIERPSGLITLIEYLQSAEWTVRGFSMGSLTSRKKTADSQSDQGALFNLIDFAPLVPVAAPNEPLTLGGPSAPKSDVDLPQKPQEPEQIFEVGQRVAIASTAMLYPGKLGKVRAISGLGYAVKVDGVTGPPWPMFLAQKLSPVEDSAPQVLPQTLAEVVEVKGGMNEDAIAPAPTAPQPAPASPPALQIPDYAPGETLCEWRWWPSERGGQWRYAGYMGMAGYAEAQHDDGVLLPHGFDPNQALGTERSKP